MTISLKELEELSFHPTHEWFDNGGAIKSRTVPGHHANAGSSSPMVYMWLTPLDRNHETFRLLYVGKAGAGISRRNVQHEGGFKNSDTGRKNQELIRQVLSTGTPVLIYSRISDRLSILGQEIPVYSAEEEALCERFSPEWNRAQFAVGAKRGNKASRPPISSEGNTAMTPVTGHLSDYDFSRLARADEIYSFVESISQEDRDQLARLLDWAFDIQQQYRLEQKVVLRFSDHPPGYNNIPMLVFARFGDAGKAKSNSWMVRIPLRSDDKYPLTVILPERLKSARVRINAIVDGNKDNFRPLDLADFLAGPSNYVRLP